MLKLDAGLLLIFSLLVTLEEIVEGCELNLLFFRKPLYSPLNEVNGDLGARVETLDKLDSTNRVVEDRLDEERSGLELECRRGRSFGDEIVDRRRSTLDD